MNADEPLTSLTEANNKRLVREMYEAGKRGDAPGFFAALSEDIVVHEPAFLPYGGIYRGHDGFRRLFGTIMSLLDISSLRLDGLYAEDDRVIGILYLALKNGEGGLTLAEESLLRDGKVVEMRIYVHAAGSLVPAAAP